MIIHMKAIEDRTPKDNKPMFEYSVDGIYGGRFHEVEFYTDEKEIKKKAN